jgi:sugar/nucleoside kinase (ribokinase family)
MKFLLLGHYAIDVLHDNGAEQEQRGGMHRVIASMAGLASRQDRIVPVFGVQGEELPALLQELKELPNVDAGGIYAMDTPSHRVHYFPQANGTRVACVKEMADPIPFERIRKFLDADGVLINMMSGADLRLETLDEIRMAIRGTGTKLHLDVHNLTLGVGADGVRIRRPVPEWRRWAFMADILQLNEEEIAGLTAERMPERQAVGHLLTLAVKAVVVTRAVRGATLYTSEHKQTVRKDVAAPPAAADPGVGSGDRFGAAFFLRYCATGNPGEALDFALSTMNGTG